VDSVRLGAGRRVGEPVTSVEAVPVADGEIDGVEVDGSISVGVPLHRDDAGLRSFEDELDRSGTGCPDHESNPAVGAPRRAERIGDPQPVHTSGAR
jgi:hypothetical protein